MTEAGPVPWGNIEVPGGITYPRFRWSIAPATPASLFDPDQPVRIDLAVVGAASVEFMPGLTVNAAISPR